MWPRPEIITQLGVGAVFVIIVLKEVFKFVNHQKNGKNGAKPPCNEKFLTEEAHDLMCENATLKIEAHFKEHFDGMKDDVFGNYRKIEKLIKDNGHD